MFAIGSILLALVGVASAAANPIADPTGVGVEARSPTPKSELAVRDGTPSSSGFKDGYYYSFWTDGAGSVYFTNGSGGSYSVTWSGSGNWFAGKGWSPGSPRIINFSADFSPSGNAYLSVYGWSTNPLVEYYIVENFGTFNPQSLGTYKGKFWSDGSEYSISTVIRYPLPSVTGGPNTQILRQYWSVRQIRRSSGTVTTANHFNAWKQYNMTLGPHNYQILAVEGYYSSGSANVTVW